MNSHLVDARTASAIWRRYLLRFEPRPHHGDSNQWRTADCSRYSQRAVPRSVAKAVNPWRRCGRRDAEQRAITCGRLPANRILDGTVSRAAL